MEKNNIGAYLLLSVMPLCFSTNLVFGRATVPVVEPWTLAGLRWSFACLILLPFCWKDVVANAQVFRSNWILLAILGFLGMWICGAVVYFALRYTSATNGVLIYTSSPIFIILIERYFRGRKISLREICGITVAVLGVVVIVTTGSIQKLLGLDFNLGDLLIVISALSFAIYSVLLKRTEFSNVATLPMFTMVCLAGAATLLPFTLIEIQLTGSFPTGQFEWINIGGIVVVSSILAFLTYQIGVKAVGPSITGLFMYLMPAYGVALSVIFLGETLHTYHIVGSILIVSGLIIATIPIEFIRNLSQRLSIDHQE